MLAIVFPHTYMILHRPLQLGLSMPKILIDKKKYKQASRF